MRLALASLVVAACGFAHGRSGATGDGNGGDTPGGGGSDATGDSSIGPDGAMAGFVVLHVPAGSATFGTAALAISSNLTIDTDARTIGGAPPPGGVTFDYVTQMLPGPQLAVLHVTTFTVQSSITARVVGSRPLVVIASGTISIDGILDAGAALDQYGAGGGAPAAGDRPGVKGSHDQTYCDAGGGGGGQATTGGTGGSATGTGSVSGETCNAAGGAAGGTVGDMPITVLAGGSGGGPGRGGASGNDPACVAAGGAGGGAVQLSSATAVSITGEINVGGGGGHGGVGTNDQSCTNRGSGGGGGSAGSIVLQSPSITVGSGAFVVALGGGGGGGATVGTDGGGGGNGTTSAGTPGASAGTYGADGGTGGATGRPTNGGTSTVGDGNGGGAGGSAGRIAVYRSATGTANLLGTLSPAAYAGTY